MCRATPPECGIKNKAVEMDIIQDPRNITSELFVFNGISDEPRSSKIHDTVNVSAPALAKLGSWTATMVRAMQNECPRLIWKGGVGGLCSQARLVRAYLPASCPIFFFFFFMILFILLYSYVHILSD